MIEKREKTIYNYDYFINLYENLDDSQCCIGKLVEQDKTTGLLKYDCIGHLHRPTGAWDLFRRKILFSLAPNCCSAWDKKLKRFSNIESPRERLIEYLREQKLYKENQKILDNL